MSNSPGKGSTISTDLIAGLTASIPSVPNAMASGVLARVSQRYTQNLKECQGKLILVSEPVRHQLDKTGLISEMGDSTRQAYQDAVAWLAAHQISEA